jgi:hypothetical protein
MARQPQTSAFALLDSPVGLLAWNAQFLGEDLDTDFALTNVMLYWLTGTGASAARLYYENAHAAPQQSQPQSRSGWPPFGGEFSGIRRFAQRVHANLVHWATFDHGGHFAATRRPTTSSATHGASSGPSGEAISSLELRLVAGTT